MRYWESHWYRSTYSFFTVLLLPFSWLFRIVVAIRYFCYQKKWKKTYHFPVPVIVVGNITVGGTGKTPFVIWLAQLLKKQGFRPGIISRGVGGKAQQTGYWVSESSDPSIVGDEALVLARRAGCPLVISVDRVAAIKELLANSDCNIVISDDGLQHYRLGRTVEIALIDGTRGLGNGCLLPAGPLREPAKRLKKVDVIVRQGGMTEPGEFAMELCGDTLISVQNEQHRIPLKSFNNQTVHAVAALGNPQRFFSLLRQQGGLTLIEHIFPDHYSYQISDLSFEDTFPVVMTEKDAVKCRGLVDEKCWYLPVTARLDKTLAEYLLKKII